MSVIVMQIFVGIARTIVTFSAFELGQGCGGYGICRAFLLCHARTLAKLSLPRSEINSVTRKQVPHQVLSLVMHFFLGVPRMIVTFSPVEVAKSYGLGRPFIRRIEGTLACLSLPRSDLN